MIDFAELQDVFQKAILDGDDTVLSTLAQGAFADRRDLLNVYRTSYTSRLVGVLKNNYPLLHAYLGTDAFEGSAQAYIAACPSRHQNARQYARGFSRFISESETCKGLADVRELSRIELAVNDAFDAAEAPSPSSELRTVPEAYKPSLALSAHPSVTFLTLTSNAFAIWCALSGGGEVPPPMILEQTESVFVWRRDTKPLVRAANAEEALLWIAMTERSASVDTCGPPGMERTEGDRQDRIWVHLSRWLSDEMLTAAAEPAVNGMLMQ